MQDTIFRKIEDWAVALGVLLFGSFLILDLVRDGHPAWIVFDAAMLALCFGYAAARLFPGSAGVFTLVAVNLLVGTVLVGTFTFFAFQAVNVFQALLSVFIVGMGLFTVGATAKRIRVRRISGDRR